jgi:hypothetical protein
MKSTLENKEKENQLKKVLITSGYSESVTHNIWKLYNAKQKRKLRKKI